MRAVDERAPRRPSVTKPSNVNARRAGHPLAYRPDDPPVAHEWPANSTAKRRCPRCGATLANTFGNWPSIWEAPVDHDGPLPCRRCFEASPSLPG